MDLVKKYHKELSGLQRKYIDIQDKGMHATDEEKKIKSLLRQEYKEGRLMELGIDLMNASLEVRSDFISEIYKIEDLKFVEKYLDEVNDKVKKDILTEEYRKGNKELVLRNFSLLQNDDIREALIKDAWENNNMNFLCENYEYIHDDVIKGKILQKAFDEQRIGFIEEHFDELPRNVQVEAVIKFKNLNLPEEKVLKLLK